MAQTGKQKQAGATPPAAGQAGATPSGGEGRPSFFSRFLMPPAQRGGPQTAQARGQQSPFGKRLMGLVILYFVITVVTFGLQILDSSVFKNTLQKPWFHTNAFIIGGINNTYFVVLLVVVAVAYYVLMRFKLIPRDLFFANPRTPAATQTHQPGRAAPDGLGAERRTRAARRHTATTVATRPAPTTRRTATAKAHAPAPPPAPTGHDEEYYRVKAAARQQRRREAKR